MVPFWNNSKLIFQKVDTWLVKIWHTSINTELQVNLKEKCMETLVYLPDETINLQEISHKFKYSLFRKLKW